MSTPDSHPHSIGSVSDEKSVSSERAAFIPKPDFPNRAGVAAAGTGILVIVALLCIFQYWLLTATLEAFHAGDHSLPLGAFLASLGCFILAAGLMIVGEIALLKQQDFLRSSKAGRAWDSSIRAEETEPFPTLSGPDVQREENRG